MTATAREFTYPQSVHHVTEANIRAGALNHPCPSCGAAKSIRCRFVTHRPARPGYVAGTKVDVRPRPCDERVTLAWRDMLAEVTA